MFAFAPSGGVALWTGWGGTGVLMERLRYIVLSHSTVIAAHRLFSYSKCNPRVVQKMKKSEKESARVPRWSQRGVRFEALRSLRAESWALNLPVRSFNLFDGQRYHRLNPIRQVQ